MKYLSAILLLGVLCGSPTQAARPNMVIVLVDDHAFEAISAYRTYL